MPKSIILFPISKGLLTLIAVLSATVTMAQFPPLDSLPVIEEIPDPFQFFDSEKRVATLDDWEQRRKEMKKLLEYYEYGQAFPLPYNTIGDVTSSSQRFGDKATFYEADLSMGPNHSVKGILNYLIPNSGTGPYPVILYTKYNPGESDLGSVFLENVIDRGYMVAEWYVYQYDADSNQVGPVQQAYPQYDGATLMAWSWGASAMITYLSSLDEVDTNKIIMVGNSRRGKTTLVTGALDKRIDLTVPSCSGCQGFPIFRFYGDGSCHLRKPATQFPHWSNSRFKDFIDKETKLPFDQHFLGALVAPRALLAIEGSTDENANQEGSQETYRGLLHVYGWVDAADNIGWSEHNGGHGFFEDDWYTMLDFAEKVFEGKTPKSGKEFDKLVYPPQDLFSWTAPDPPVSLRAPASPGVMHFAVRHQVPAITISTQHTYTLTVNDVSGKEIASRRGTAPCVHHLTAITKPGLYFITLTSEGVSVTKKFYLLR